MGDLGVVLNSFIVSPTRIPDLTWWNGGMAHEELESRNVLFQRDDRPQYIEKILRKATNRA